MDQKFTCPACGHETTYRPEECARFTRYEADGNKIKESRFRLVFCAG